MQDNSKYPRIKKIHQMLEKIARFDLRRPKSIVSCYHMNYCLQKYTTHQFTYFIYYLFQHNFKNAKMIKIQEVHQEIHAKQFLLFYLNCFLLATHLNLMRLNFYYFTPSVSCLVHEFICD